MKTAFCCLTLLFLSALTGNAQDTVLVSERVHFSTKEAPRFYSKGYHGRYGREDVVYDKNHKKVEYCYYEGNERKCKSRDYRIVGDSVLSVTPFDSWNDNGTTVWHFRKMNEDRYSVYRTGTTFLESGVVTSLMPMTFEGPVITMLPDKRDTLWSLYYDIDAYLYSWSDFRVDFHKTAINDPVYEYNEIDIAPKLADGNPIPVIEIDGVVHCPSESMKLTSKHTMVCIITEEGNIVNVEQAYGGLSDHCPYTLMRVIHSIRSMGPLLPAKKNGKNVAVRWFISATDNEHSGTLEHPAFVDTDERRLQYIRSKKKSSSSFPKK